MNKAITKIISIIGLALAIAGLVHGTFEILQGNAPTGGLIIQAIGDAQQQWVYGTEEAFTILPTFLSAGILTNLISIMLGIWSFRYLSHKHGASIFLGLCILLFLVGGGIAQLVFFLPAWGIATRINKPIKRWEKLPEKMRRGLAPYWPVLVGIGLVSFLIGLFISITGSVPWVNSADPQVILNICWTFIFGGGWGFFALAVLSGFAADSLVKQQEEYYDTI
ncbi:MAG: hypothetical protein JEZ00_07000 [Anaerolineaceae bacterium]|nr:hypothetical protein [Anaerolineaceae bacterium]